MKNVHRFNLAVNDVAKVFGLMIFFTGWLPTGICKRPKFGIYDGKPHIIEDDFA